MIGIFKFFLSDYDFFSISKNDHALFPQTVSFYKFVILLAVDQGKWAMRGFNIAIFGMITVSLDVRIVNFFVLTAI